MEIGLLIGVTGIGFLLEEIFGGHLFKKTIGGNENKKYLVKRNFKNELCVYASANGPCSKIIYDWAFKQYYVIRPNKFLFILKLDKTSDGILFVEVVPLVIRSYFEGFDEEGFDEDGYNKDNFSRGGLRRINDVLGSNKEEKCRQIFEKITGNKFYSVVSSKNPILWLRSNIRSTPEEEPFLDFDGYNKELKIAFEYNGPFHFSHKYFNELSNDSYKKFRKYIANDEEKKELAKKYHVRLISIPYTIKESDLENYIRSRLYDIQYLPNKIPNYMNEINLYIDYKQYY